MAGDQFSPPTPPKTPLTGTSMGVAASAVFTQVPSGATLRPIYVERQVKIYGVYENELRTLNMFSGIVTIAASMAGVAAGFGLSMVWEWVKAQDTHTANQAAGFFFVTLLVILGCLFLGRWALKEKGGELAAIFKESRVVGSEPQ